MQHAALLFAFAVGLTTAGIVSTLYELASDDSPSLDMIAISDLYTPFRIVVAVIAAPIMLFNGAFAWAMKRSPLSLGFLSLGVIWSFLQGVFILTTLLSLS